MYLFCNSRIHVITLYSGHVCVYYASMLWCWHLIWILVMTDHPCLWVRCHIDCIQFSGKLAFSLMTCAIILAKAWFCVDNKHICDHLVDVSINIMKYLNGPLLGCIGPHMSSYILSRNFSGSVCILTGEGIKINFLHKPCI
jgi:hypothetical protein